MTTKKIKITNPNKEANLYLLNSAYDSTMWHNALAERSPIVTHSKISIHGKMKIEEYRAKRGQLQNDEKCLTIYQSDRTFALKEAKSSPKRHVNTHTSYMLRYSYMHGVLTNIRRPGMCGIHCVHMYLYANLLGRWVGGCSIIFPFTFIFQFAYKSSRLKAIKRVNIDSLLAYSHQD